MRNETEIRAEVLAVDRALAAAPANEAMEGLRSAWARLVTSLALGPAPELRTCPHCGAAGIRAATRCGVCWARLAPPDERGTP